MASVLYVVNTNSQVVNANGVINLGSIVRKSCNSQATLDGNTISLSGAGYFVVDVNTTFTGNGVIALYQNGVQVAGATGGADNGSVSFACEIKNCCCGNLTLVNTGAAITLTNVAVRVKRDA